MSEKNFLAFKTFAWFESGILDKTSAHDLDYKIKKSKAFEIISKQNKLVLPIISDFFNSDTSLDKLAHFYIEELEKAWIILLNQIAVANNIDSKPSTSDSFKEWRDWLNIQ